jgi:hypothetical protein
MRRFQTARTVSGKEEGSKAVNSRMGRWKDSVQRVTRQRKKRYCNPSGCACRTMAFVMPSWGGRSGDVDVVLVEEQEGW